MDTISEVLHEMDDLLTRLIAARRHPWRVIREPEFQRPELVRFILTRVFHERHRDPSLALDLAKVATDIVETLPAIEVGGLRFQSWIYTASLLRERARYGEAEEALAQAESASHSAADPEVALASIWLSRALLCAEPDVWKPAEAEAWLDQAETVSVTRGDAGRLVSIQTARAFLLFRSGDLQGARQKFEALLDATSITSREAHLNALSNLMRVRVELGEADHDVELEVQRLIDENDAIGQVVPAAHARWMMGRVDMILGRYHHAVELFKRASEEIDDADASLRIGLDAAEALLLDGRHSDGQRLAQDLASAAVALDQREPSRRRALTAQVLAYLKAAAQREAWTPDLVADLGRYVDQITRQRPFDFIPPMPLADM
ncbi:MAG TPA: hypothetical protein VGQ76_00405 [Thermoanaerobaculia bacterium]|nr:hypothetical protein [Thermoanaerobaculia bacterium]